MNINEQIGRRIKVRRVELGLTQAELAKKLSIGQSNLSYIERGERDVSLSLLDEIGFIPTKVRNPPQSRPFNLNMEVVPKTSKWLEVLVDFRNEV